MVQGIPSKLKCILILIIFNLINESCFSWRGAGVAASDDDLRDEIEKLRSELSEAFEKHEEEQVAEMGVVVQPSWTQKDAKAKIKGDGKVVVSDEGLKETASLRDEIGKAVNKDTYVPSVQSSKDKIAELEKALISKGASKDGENKVGDTKEADAEEELLGAVSDDDSEDDDMQPNVVESNAFIDPGIDLRKLQRLEVAKRRTREILILKYVEEDFSFDLGDDVQQWVHIVHARQEYFVGRRTSDLVIIRSDGNKYLVVATADVGSRISYLRTFTYWSVEQHQQVGIILVATRDRVLWYRANRESGQIELFWEWVVGHIISGLTHFTLDSNDYLVVSSNQSSRTGRFALNIYQFNLNTEEFWIAQRIQLKDPCHEVSVLNTGRDLIMAIPQNNNATIYGFNPHETSSSHIQFELRRHIESEGLTTISGFQMGGRSYLALGGNQPQILLYQQGDFVLRTILGNNFGLVDLFLPIPVRTYRDDLILLVQHSADFGTHKVTVLETLIWNGEAFEASIPVPCHLGSHVVYGVSCMLDLQRDEGLKGAALMGEDDKISVIVPRHNAESGLFRLHTELLARNSELLDLQEIYKFLQDWVQEQDNLIAEARAFLAMSDNDILRSQPDFSELELLKTPELFFGGNVEEIYLNDYKWSLEDSNTDLDFVIAQIEELANDLHSHDVPDGRFRRDAHVQDLLFESLNFDEVTADELIVERLNNEPFYIQEGSIDFPGIVRAGNLSVLEKVDVKRQTQSSVIGEEELLIEGDLEFEEINGVPWREIADNIVLREQDVELEKLEVEGEIVVEQQLNVTNLNSLKFPDDFLLSNGPVSSVVTAEKVFAGTISANAIDIDGHINGVSPQDAITLIDEQDWAGFPTFAHLEVSEKLELNGTAQGGDIQNLPNNPTLEESNAIEASCSFQELEVLGPIFLKGFLDDQSLGTVLSDIVLNSANASKEISIPSNKTFSTVGFPIDFHIDDLTINGIPLEQFVTVHTQQDIEFDSLEGYVYFHNLSISGLYDGVRIEELLRNVVKLDEPQTLLNTQLNFVDVLQAESVNVRDTLNGVSVSENLQTINEDLYLPEALFEHLEAKTANIAHDVEGPGELNGLDLKAFLEQRSWSRPSDSGNIFLNELILESGLETDEVHSIKADFLLNFLEEIDELPEMVLNGQIQVNHVVVTGDVQLSKLNGHQFDEELQMTAVWLNRPNYLSTNLRFEEPVEVHGNLNVVGDFNGQYLPDIIDDIVVRHTNRTAVILAPKGFSRNVLVRGNTGVEALNGVPSSEIATKKNMNHFKGSLEVRGNLVVDELEIEGSLNHYPMQGLSKLLRYDARLQAFVLLGEIPILRPQYLEDLTVYGDLNDIPRLGEFFNSLVYKDRMGVLRGKKTFTGRVSIERGAYIGSLNGYNLLALLNNIVLKHESKPVFIRAPVLFAGAVKANEMTIKNSLQTPSISGCDLEEWLRESLLVDSDEKITHYLNFVAGSLNGNSLRVRFLNNIDLAKVVTLHTPQNLTNHVTFSELYLEGEMNSRGPVNGVDLQEEFNNTLLTYGNQRVTTPLTLPSISVLNHLLTNVPVNGDKDLREVATLHEDLDFESPLYFQSLTAREVHTNAALTGVDFDDWFRKSVRSKERPQQWITGNWSTRSLTVTTNPSTYDYMVNGIPAKELDTYMRTPRNSADNKEFCGQLKTLWRRQQKRSLFVKYLEEEFHLDLHENEAESAEAIRKVFHMSSSQDNFLVINVGCHSHVYRWRMARGRYEFLTHYESGLIDHLVMLPTNGSSPSVQFITSYGSTEPLNCSLAGVNVWKTYRSGVAHEGRLKDEITNVSDMWQTAGRVYAIAQYALHEIPFGTSSTQGSSWNLPTSTNDTTYRFIPHNNTSERIFLTNGQHFLLLRASNQSGLEEVTDPTNSEDYPSSAKSLAEPSQLSLNPNSTAKERFTFGDFKQMMERILLDLEQRLSLEINVTQLSIPETDLFDEHLVPDFLAIMEELQKQQIFPLELFAQIDFNSLQVPSNPAQVLAIRTVQMVWPTIVEVEELHRHLRGQSQSLPGHPVCGCIMNLLGLLVRDVLLLANIRNSSQSADDTHDVTQELSDVIERIQHFQTELAVLNKELTKDVLGSYGDPEKPRSNVEFTPHSDPNATLMYLDLTHWPAQREEELLSLEVSSSSQPRLLLAVTSANLQHVPGLPDTIDLYTDALKRTLFQSIPAHGPHSLTTLRIRDETLLAYIGNCCSVHVLRYRGVEGFVPFANFQTDHEVTQLRGISVPQVGRRAAYYLVAAMGRKLHFYKVVLVGPSAVPAPLLSCT